MRKKICSTMIHLLRRHDLWSALKEFTQKQPCLGICAGAILLAKKVSSPEQESLGTMEISAQRNAYGRQINSFIGRLNATESWKGPDHLEGVFIRAPRITPLQDMARVMMRYEQDDVLIEQENLLAATFHPELVESNAIHEYFLNKCRQHYQLSKDHG